MASLTLLLLFSLSITFLPSTTSQFSFTPSPTPLPQTPSPLSQQQQQTTTTTATLPVTTSPFNTLTTILTSLGYTTLALASHKLTLSTTTTLPLTPITVFAPTDSSLLTCTSCSFSTLLLSHSLPGLYSSSYLSSLPFDTKLESLLPGRCITLTSTHNSSHLYVSGADVTSPELFTSAHVIIHGISGYLSHLSPYSCSIDKMTSLFLHHSSPSTALTRMMLADAMIRLRTSGYSILSLAMRVKYPDLITLDNMTIFALDDTSIFNGGQAYVHSVRFHILPNILLRYNDLEKLSVATVLPTLEIGESLTVTSSGGGDLSSPLRINYVRVKFPDMISNMKLDVHGLSSPFPRLSHAITSAVTRQRTRQYSNGETVSQQVEATSKSPPVVSKSDNTNNVLAAGDYNDYVHHGL